MVMSQTAMQQAKMKAVSPALRVGAASACAHSAGEHTDREIGASQRREEDSFKGVLLWRLRTGSSGARSVPKFLDSNIAFTARN
jgi:hypothetical protein